MTMNPFSSKTAYGSKLGWDERASIYERQSQEDEKEHDGDEPEPMDAEEEKAMAWKHIFKTMEAHDEGQIESWKSEMDNLLIFAALYSAVVSAFVVDSYHLVAPDDSDTTLFNISARLMSFRLTSSFANATTLSDPANENAPPPDFAIKVNTLWFLSLTLSIIAAFFAIAVQQWLRHIRIPKHIPIRDAIRLRQLRHKGLMKWQVPVIITALPALVQISVVLFLVGLLQYVRNASKDVALPFTVVSSISLVLFVIVSFIPLLDPSCPYKSPLVHIVWELSWIAGVIATVVIILPIVTILDCATPRKHATWSSLANKIYQLHQRYLMKLRPSTTEASRFWTARESGLAARRAAGLDQEALAWALTAGPRISKLACCLHDLSPLHRTRCVLSWISVKFFGQADVTSLLSKGRTISEETLDRIKDTPGQFFASEYASMLLSVLTEGWTADVKREDDFEIPHIVTLLWYMADQGYEISFPPHKESTKLRVPVINHLVPLCLDWSKNGVKKAKSWQGWQPTIRVPFVTLFDLLKDDHKKTHYFANTDALVYMKVAIKITKDVTEVQEGDSAALYWLAPTEHVLSTCAIALLVLVANSSLLAKDDVRSTLDELFDTLHQFATKAKKLDKLVDRWEKRLEKDSESLPFITPHAINSICSSIKLLGKAKEGLSNDDGAGRKLAEHLLEVCKEKKLVNAARDDLNHFLGRSSEKPTRERSETMMSMSNMPGVQVIDEVPELTMTGPGPSEDNDGSK